MAKRDPAKTALNKQIDKLTSELEPLQSRAMAKLGSPSVQALHARIGGKNAEFIDVKHEIILSPEAYVCLWLRGLMRVVDNRRPCEPGDPYQELIVAMKQDAKFRDYVTIFLKRTYLRNQDSLSKARPHTREAALWIGQNKADYGLLVTPRFSNGDWENDKSEIRHFAPDYWTIGHVMQTGLVVPGDPDRIEFARVQDYLAFFKNTLVRASGSPHEAEIAKRYVDYVRKSANPLSVPLLIPELRYRGRDSQHKYRLDFTIISPHSMDKVGFELSPWSTHGELTKIKEKTQKQVNEEALGNFEGEMKKQKDYFRRHGIYALIYTDSDLADPDGVFRDMEKYFAMNRRAVQLEVLAFDELERFEP